MESRVHAGVLERMLADESTEPTHLPLSLLQGITNCFSLDHQIGTGGFAVVYKVVPPPCKNKLQTGLNNIGAT